MSAFSVDHDHIDALLTFAVAEQLCFTLPNGDTLPFTMSVATQLGQVLLLANTLGVAAAYPHLPVPADESGSYRFRPVAQPLSAAQIAGAVTCLDYQCCEAKCWKGSFAHGILAGIKAAVAHADGTGHWEFQRARAAA